MVTIGCCLRFFAQVGVPADKFCFVQMCDNLGDVMAIAKSASGCRTTRALVLAIREWAEVSGVSFIPCWIRGSRNHAADALTRDNRFQHFIKQYPDAKIYDIEESQNVLFWWEMAWRISSEIESTNPGGNNSSKTRTSDRR